MQSLVPVDRSGLELQPEQGFDLFWPFSGIFKNEKKVRVGQNDRHGAWLNPKKKNLGGSKILAFLNFLDLRNIFFPN